MSEQNRETRGTKPRNEKARGLSKEAIARAFIAVAEANFWDVGRAHKELQNFCKNPKSGYSDQTWPGRDTVRRIFDNKRVAADDFAILIHDWLKMRYPEHLEREMRVSEFPFVSSCRLVLGRDNEARPEKMEKFHGHYALYRPYHEDPKRRIIRELLSIGNEKDPFSASFKSRYPDEPRGLDATGTCVPHGIKLMIVMTVDTDKYSHCIFYLDRMTRQLIRPENGDVPHATELSGIMTASVNPQFDASAWPVYLHRIDDPAAIELDVLDPTDFLRTNPTARRALQKGSVYWNDEHFERPFPI